MNQSVVHVDFSENYQAPLLDSEIIREAVANTIDEFGHAQFARTLIEEQQELLLAA